MPFDVNIGSSVELELRHAILIYGRRGHHEGPSAYATLHDVQILDGKPQIAAGTSITRDNAVRTFRDLTSSSDDLTYIPERLIARNMSITCWYRPSRPAPMWFERKLDDLATLSGRHFHQPGLIFFATDAGLTVRAFIGVERPTPNTELFLAPYLNTAANGIVCLGSATRPTETGAAAIDGWERSFFESRFSHPHAGKTRLTRIRGGIAAHWKGNLAAKTKGHRNDWLVSARETLGEALAAIQTTRA